MPLIEIKVIKGTISDDEKQELIERLTDVVVSVKGEPLRRHTWVLITEVQSRAWGSGGIPVSTDDVNALLATH